MFCNLYIILLVISVCSCNAKNANDSLLKVCNNISQINIGYIGPLDTPSFEMPHLDERNYIIRNNAIKMIAKISELCKNIKDIQNNHANDNEKNHSIGYNDIAIDNNNIEYGLKPLYQLNILYKYYTQGISLNSDATSNMNRYALLLKYSLAMTDDVTKFAENIQFKQYHFIRHAGKPDIMKDNDIIRYFDEIYVVNGAHAPDSLYGYVNAQKSADELLALQAFREMKIRILQNSINW